LDTTLEIESKGTVPFTQFNFDGYQTYDANNNPNRQIFAAYSFGDSAQMKLKYDQSANRGVVRRVADQVPIVSANDFASGLGFGVGFAMKVEDESNPEVSNSEQTVEISGTGSGELGKDKWGASAVIYGAGYKVNDVTIPAGFATASGLGTFMHFARGNNYLNMYGAEASGGGVGTLNINYNGDFNLHFTSSVK
jgi:hypothetical protein